MKNAWISLGAACALVIGVYACVAQAGVFERVSSNAADARYNLLVQGFRAGQLNLKKEVPPGFARLADPYDPTVSRFYWGLPYGMGDLSYYKGRLYLYFGVTPALILFWPFLALTGHYLVYRQAVTVFCAVGFLSSVGLLCAVWRRYFSEVSVWVVATCALALGLATGVPLLLPPSGTSQVVISCGYMLTMLALGAVWCALRDTERKCRWLMTASVAYGLAVGARPSLLFGAMILLAPVGQAWRERRPIWPALMAATIPITLIGLGLMLYNELRFDSPFEFGQHYQLASVRSVGWHYFRPRYLWFNFRVYFLEPARWSSRFPFVHGIAVPPLPAGYVQAENPFGILTNIPLVWLALAAPLAWRNQSEQGVLNLRLFVTASALIFGTCALPLGFFSSATDRYEVDFLPGLVLVAVVGILALERALSDRQVLRRAAQCGWGLLLGFSVAFNLLASVERCAEAHNNQGVALVRQGRLQEAIEQYERALGIEPDYAEARNNLGVALMRRGRLQEAIEQYEQALRLKSDDAEAHNNLGVALVRQGRLQEAIEQYERALIIEPDYGEAQYNLGVALEQAGQVQEAVGHYEQALQIKPDLAEAHNNLGLALARTGHVQEAIGQWEQFLRLKPDDAEAHYNLGKALAQVGRVPEAIGQYEQALRLRPDLTAARNALERLHAGQ
jgi:tetratricopeptide (TPR) repeat protein